MVVGSSGTGTNHCLVWIYQAVNNNLFDSRAAVVVQPKPSETMTTVITRVHLQVFSLNTEKNIEEFLQLPSNDVGTFVITVYTPVDLIMDLIIHIYINIYTHTTWETSMAHIYTANGSFQQIHEYIQTGLVRVCTFYIYQVELVDMEDLTLLSHRL